jgi:hypothetical protein
VVNSKKKNLIKVEIGGLLLSFSVSVVLVCAVIATSTIPSVVV